MHLEVIYFLKTITMSKCYQLGYTTKATAWNHYGSIDGKETT